MTSPGPGLDGVEILDSTLREGEQTRGVTFTQDEKTRIARHLDALGVGYVEAGHPAVSRRVADHVEAVAGQDLEATVLAHARATPEDVDAAVEAGVDGVGIFFSLTDRRLEEHFRTDEDEATRLVQEAVAHARDHGLLVRYTPEDTVRSDPDRVVRVARAAVEAGADRISVADTTGAMTPPRMRALVADLDRRIPVPLHVHCHDDLGLAVANSLAAVEAGAAVVDASVNGLGERAGLADLAPLATALDLHHDDAAGWALDELPDLARRVADASGLPVPATAPIVGRNAFSHNAGLHVSAVLQDPGHYESVPARRVGRQRHIVVDQFSGRDAVRHRLEELGADPTDAEVEAVLETVESRALDDVTDPQLALLYLEATDGGGAVDPEAAAPEPEVA